VTTPLLLVVAALTPIFGALAEPVLVIGEVTLKLVTEPDDGFTQLMFPLVSEDKT
jgi:hypothetical protein